jgi:spermidine synthase
MPVTVAAASPRLETTFPGAPVLAAFFVSGACGLIHEVVWTRLLRHVMGNTTFAITTVLCAFMAGLALGSYLAGRIVDRRNDPLRVFAFLEGTIGVYCLLLPWLIDGMQPLYKVLYQHTHTTFYVFGLIRFLFSGLILLVPATFMGATLPVLTKFFTRSPERLGWSVGTLYAVNTFGAVLGAWSSGFILMPALGVTPTLYLACLFNVLVGGAAYGLYRRSLKPERATAPREGDGRRNKPEAKKKGKGAPGRDAAAKQTVPSSSPGLQLALLVGYGLSGFAALVYEIAWTRALSLLIGSTVYAFSAMLTAFVLGLAVGAAVCSRWVDRLRDPLRFLVGLQLGIGFSALLVVPVIGRLPLFVTGMIAELLDSFWVLQAGELALVLAVMLVPTTLMGAAFPVVNRLYNQESARVGRAVGSVYAANTLGTILGSFAGGFLLIPGLGIQKTIVAASAINLVVGVGFLLLRRGIATRLKAAAAGAVVFTAGVCIAVIPAWDAALMSLGPYHEAVRMSKETALSRRALEELAGASKILYHKEDVTTTVTVKEMPGGYRSLHINGKPDASTTFPDLPSQELVAHVPLLLHPDPRRALVLGLASGITLGSVGRHPLEQIDCVEISPAMLQAARLFDDYNYRILDDPRVKVIITDGRNHLALTDKRYDVIISQPSNPYLAGVADLFTREFFQVCRERLAPDGVMCSWIQTYNIDLETLTSIVRTFQGVFPTTTLWASGMSDLLMVGSGGNLSVDYASLKRRLQAAGVAGDLRRIQITSVADFLGRLVMGPEGARRLAAAARIHTDDNALVEFAAPRAMTRTVYQGNLLEAVEKNREADLSFLKAGEGDVEVEKELLAVKEQATRFIQARGHVTLAHLFRSQGRDREAQIEIHEAARLNPTEIMLKDFNEDDHRLAYNLVKEGKVAEAADVYRRMIERLPVDEKAHYNLGVMLKREGDLGKALQEFREAVRLKPDYLVALYNAADLSERLGARAEALAYHRRALEVKADYLPSMTGLARILATDPDPRVRNVREAVRLAERSSQLAADRIPLVLDTLSLAYAAAGRMPEAEDALRRGIKVAAEQGDQQLAQEMQRRLQLYQEKSRPAPLRPSPGAGSGPS